MCDCINTINEKMRTIMFEKHPECTEVIEDAKLMTTALMMSSNGSSTYYATYSEVEGRFKQKKANRKFSVNMYHTYCPFCGEKYEK